MFVVEQGSGKDQVYASARELAAAIRRGELGAEARIYHRATAQWLPITVHPEYRRVTAERDRIASLQLRDRHWTFLPNGGPREGPGSAPAPAVARPADHASGPVLIPGDPEPSWLGSTLRRLRNLAHL